MGTDSDRILLVLDRPSVGEGAVSQELGLAGHLARQVSALSGRGTDIDVIANGNMTAEATARALTGLDLTRFDSIILMVGSSEALSLVAPRRWGADLRQLLREVTARVSSGTCILVVDVPPTRALINFPAIFDVVVGARIGRLNAVTRVVCAEHDSVSVLPFLLPEAKPNGRNSSVVFRHWATFIAPTVRRELDRSAGVHHDDSPVDEEARQEALDRLQVIDSSPDPRIDWIVGAARQRFNTEAAALTFLDNDRRWVKSAIGASAADSPRKGSLCDRAIVQSSAFVVENIRESDYRSELTDQDPATKFYAGFPIEAPDGRRVGVLCIMDTEPRQFSKSDETVLRELALQIQLELWNGH